MDYAAQPLNLEHVRLSKLLRTVIAAHMNAQLDDAHPVGLHVDERAADAMALGDERLLTRVVENDLANARLHNEAGCRIRVSLSIDEHAGANGKANRAVIRIADDGAGVTREELAALEARLARSRTARSAAGSYGEEHGLGLALADRIVRAHGGSLSLESEPARGLVVELMLPLTEHKTGSAT